MDILFYKYQKTWIFLVFFSLFGCVSSNSKVSKPDSDLKKTNEVEKVNQHDIFFKNVENQTSLNTVKNLGENIDPDVINSTNVQELRVIELGDILDADSHLGQSPSRSLDLGKPINAYEYFLGEKSSDISQIDTKVEESQKTKERKDE